MANNMLSDRNTITPNCLSRKRRAFCTRTGLNPRSRTVNTTSSLNDNLKNSEMQLDGNSKKAVQISRMRRAGQVVYPLKTAKTARNRSPFSSRIDGQVREEKGIYNPDPVPSTERDANPRPSSAIADHAKHLRKAESTIDDASNLVGLILAALDDESDGRAMQTIVGLRVIEQKLRKAHGQIDKHHTRHGNLLLAYLDLKNRADNES